VLLLLTTPAALARQFVPTSQAVPTLGKYALRKTTITDGTLAYRPLFGNGSGQGDLVQYEIDARGRLDTDARPGSHNPALPGSSGGCGRTAAGGCWMASATFEQRSSRDDTYWQEKDHGRHIFTYTDSDADGTADTQIAFLWDQLDAVQRRQLDPATAAGAPSGTAAYDSPVLNYLRGDNRHTRAHGGTYRNRSGLLGNIMNAGPVYIGPPREHYTLPGFIAFKNRYSGDHRRPGRIAVGADDGMLHIFDEQDGAEVYAYVPSMLFGKLHRLAQPPGYNTASDRYVDGQLTSVSAQLNGQWRTVLAGGLGAGAAGLFALDVTSAGADGNKILFEISAADVGHIYSQPSIVRLNGGDWFLVSGNGYGASGGGRLLLVNLNNGRYTAIATGQAAGLSGATLVDNDADQIADIAFAGDTDGNLWKFYLGDSPPPVNPERIFQPSAATGTSQPITTRPEVGVHPQGGYMVLFGTGSRLQAADRLSETYPVQALYGIRDSGAGTRLVEHRIETRREAVFGNDKQHATASIRYVASDKPVEYRCENPGSGCALGWKLTLPGHGERLTAAPQLRNGRLLVVTTNPAERGDNWLMSMDYLRGDDAARSIFDLNGDARLDDNDTVNTGTRTAPRQRAAIGLHLGSGTLSQPALARLGPGVDVLYINGLRIPVAPERSDSRPLLYGHLDVIGNTPSGGTRTDTNDKSAHSIDGLAHDYDTQHSLSYVDILDLEPRRGKPPLAPLPYPRAHCEDTRSRKSVTTANAACQKILPARLDRASDGALLPDQPFIVVLANADLSPAAVLQIGCRSWNARDYQDMITPQLEAGKTPAQLQDSAHDNASLLFTLTGLRADREHVCPDASPRPTVRISFGVLDIPHGGIHGTTPECALERKDFRKPARGSRVNTSVAGSSTTTLPVTAMPASNGGGYRWRNGALTLQLLRVDPVTGEAGYTLQDPDTLPVRKGRTGGTYARAFTLGGANRQTVIPATASPPANGLLYETALFWHLGDRGGTPPCYGDAHWHDAVQKESRGLNAQQYQALYDSIEPQLLWSYDSTTLSLQAALGAQDDTAVAQSLHTLDTLLERHEDLANYHRYREYPPYQVPASTLRELDRLRVSTTAAADTATREPAAVIDLNAAPDNTLQIRVPGPAYTTGRHAWIELDE